MGEKIIKDKETKNIPDPKLRNQKLITIRNNC